MMAFNFPDTHSERIDFCEFASLRKGFSPEYLRNLTAARNYMCDALISQPSSQGLLQSIDNYLPYLLYISCEVEKNPELSKGLGFRWRSVLSKGIRMNISSDKFEKPFIYCSSILFEVSYVLLAYSFALWNMAYRVTLPIPSRSSETSLNDAAEKLAKVSGVISALSAVFTPKWANPPKERPPECSSEILNILSELAILESNRMALAKAEKKGLSKLIWFKLANYILIGYQRCCHNLSKLSKGDNQKLSDPFKVFILDGYKLLDATILKKLAETKHDEEEYGVAVSAILSSHSSLLHCFKSENIMYRNISNDLLKEVTELKERVIRLNNTLTYQRVPEISEVRADLPTPASVKTMQLFALPQIRFPESKKQ